MSPVETATEPRRPYPAAVGAANARRFAAVQRLVDRHEPRNIVVLIVYQVVFRIGWIFKTESVIIPAFLDSISGAGWVRGLLPVLNRFGQSVPPLLYSRRLKSQPRQKRTLAMWSVTMAVPFALLAGICFAYPEGLPSWMPWLFLAAYGVFFANNGLTQLCWSTTQGKLIQPTHRGRMMAVAAVSGSSIAIVFAWCLLRSWLALPDGGFGNIFAFTAGIFLAGGLIVMALKEPAYVPAAHDDDHLPHVTGALRALRRDANLRRLALVAALFSAALILFPHYQALARERLGLGGRHLMYWVIAQNVGVALGSLVVGPLADRHGNRLTLRVILFASSLAPVVAVALGHVDGSLGRSLFWTVFLCVGLCPISLRVLVNYTLEICPMSEHARYVSIVSICLAMPFCASPLVGWLIDAIGFEPVFLAAAATIVLCGLATFRLDEPRHGPLPPWEAVPPGGA